MNIPPYINFQNEILYNDRLNQALQNGLSDQGWTLPQQTTLQITDNTAVMPDGTMWYDTTANAFKVRIAGVVKTVTVT